MKAGFLAEGKGMLGIDIRMMQGSLFPQAVVDGKDGTAQGQRAGLVSKLYVPMPYSVDDDLLNG
jgi:hypothetical protein